MAVISKMQLTGGLQAWLMIVQELCLFEHVDAVIYTGCNLYYLFDSFHFITAAIDEMVQADGVAHQEVLHIVICNDNCFNLSAVYCLVK